MAQQESVRMSADARRFLDDLARKQQLNSFIGRSKVSPPTVQRIRSGEPVRIESAKKVSKALKGIGFKARGNPWETGEPTTARRTTPRTRPTTQPAAVATREPSDIAEFVQRSTELVTTVRSVISYVGPNAETLFGNGEGREQWERLVKQAEAIR